MSSPIGPNEIRVVIRPVEARDYDLGPIPAELFKKTFDAFLTALQVTDRELQPKARSSEFLISQLALNPYEFGILEKRKALGQTHPVGDRVLPALRRGHLPQRLPDRRSPSPGDAGRLSASSRRLIRTFTSWRNSTTPSCRSTISFAVRSTGSAPRTMNVRTDNWFLGSAIMSFEGRLGRDRLSRRQSGPAT